MIEAYSEPAVGDMYDEELFMKIIKQIRENLQE